MKFCTQFLPILILPVLLFTAVNLLLLTGCGSPKSSESIAPDKISVVQNKTDRVDDRIPEHWTRMDAINNHDTPAHAWADAIQKVANAVDGIDYYPANLTDELPQFDSGEYFTTREITVDSLCLANITLNSVTYHPWFRVIAVSEREEKETELYSIVAEGLGERYVYARLLLLPNIKYRLLLASNFPGEVGTGYLTVGRSDPLNVKNIDAPSTVKGVLGSESNSLATWSTREVDGVTQMSEYSKRFDVFQTRVNQKDVLTFDLEIENAEIDSGAVITVFDQAGMYLGTAKRSRQRHERHADYFLGKFLETMQGQQNAGDLRYVVVNGGGTTGSFEMEIPYRLVAGKTPAEEFMMRALLNGR